MDIFVLLLFAPILFALGQLVFKITKISPPILYLLVGILFGGSAGVFHLLGNSEILPNMPSYNTTALLLMFFGAGFSIDINMLKNSGKVTTQLFTLPVHFEALVMTVVVFAALKLVPALGFDLSIFELGIIMILFAAASPANVIPICMSHNNEGFAGKNRITDNMIAASIADNFTIFPVLALMLLMAVAPRMGIEFTSVKVILSIFGMLAGFFALALFGLFIGFISTKLLNPIGKKIAASKDNKWLPVTYAGLYFAIPAFVISVSGPLKPLGVLIAVAAGVGVRKYEKNGLAEQLGFNSSVLFAILGSPIIFTYVGSLIDLQTLFSPLMLLFGLSVTGLACLIKGGVTRYILSDEKYSDGERKFAMSCFIPKGISLVNFSLVLMTVFLEIGRESVIDFMIMLAAISIIITVPLGVTLMNGARGKWLVTVEKELNEMGEVSVG